MDGALSSRRTDRGGRGGHNKHSHGGDSSRGGRGGGRGGRGRGGRGGARGGHQSHAYESSSNPMMFPISHQDTSTFQLPITSNSSSQQPTRPTKPPRMSNPALVSRPTSSSTAPHRHRHGESKEDDEDDEEDVEFVDSEDEDYEDDDEDYHEDEGNIFDYAEEAMVDGQKQAQLKQQRIQQQQQQQNNKAAKQQSNQNQKQRQNSQPQKQHNNQQQQDSARRLVVVTKKEREQQQHKQPQQQPQQHNQQQHNHSAPQPSQSSNSQPSESHPTLPADGKTHKQRRMEKAALKNLAAEQGSTDTQATQSAQSASARPASGNDHNRQQNNNNRSNNDSGRQKQNQPANNRSRNNGGRGGDHRSLFPEHLPGNVMDAGLSTGTYVQGVLRIIGQNAFVSVIGLPRDVFIEGRRQRNRAFDGDTVAVQIVGTDTGAGTASQQFAAQAKDKRQQAKANDKLSKQARDTALTASLENLIIDSEKKEDQKMAAERSSEKVEESASSSSSSAAPVQDPSTVGMEQRTVQSLPHQTAVAREALAKLAAAGSNVQYKGVVVGIVAAKFDVVKAPGLLKPFAEHIALFVPLDKKTPFAMLPERSWPPGFAATYRKYWQDEKARQEAKKKELQERKVKGNFPLSDESSSEIVNSPIERQNSSESNDLADAENAPVLDDHIYVASFQPWDANDRQPFCTISTNLGLSGNIVTETEALLVANGVDYDHDGKFNSDVLNEVAKYSRESSNNSGGWQIPAEEIAQRRDLRDQTKWRIVSIDPTTAKDLDDAIHVIDLGNDVIECGVHIADVSHFVRPGTKLDAEARHRATTIYLVNKAIPMLPPILCEQLCSLNPNVDRLAYTTIFYLNKSTGKLIPERKPWFGKTVIRTCARLNYETAQLLMEFDDSSMKAAGRAVTEEDFTGELRKNMTRGHPYRPVDCVSIQQLLSDMKLLHSVSMRRREDRFVMGSLTLSNVKLQFQTDAQQNPIGFYSYPIRDSNRVVEEQMLLANMVVAHQCVQFCQNMALLRCHPSPNEKAMSKVSQTCQELGFSINASTAGSLQKSLESYQGVFVGKRHGINDAVLIDGSVPLRQVLEPLCTKPMQLAKYFATSMADDPRDWHHYALHFAEYTHFTSPIRRYADIIVHRVLSLSLEIEAWKNTLGSNPSIPRPRGPASLHPDEVASISEQCNTRKASAKKAQEQSSKVYLCDYLLKFHAKTPLSSSAVLTDLASTEGHSDPTFDILIPHLGIEKKIHLNDLLRDGKIVAGDIFPKDPASTNANQSGGKNNSAANQKARAQAAASASSSSSTSGAPAAAVAKSQKRLRIEWADGTKNVYSMFDAVDVELVVRRGPPLDLDAFVISPAVAAEREKNKQNDVKEREELEATGGQESLLARSTSPRIASDDE